MTRRGHDQAFGDWQCQQNLQHLSPSSIVLQPVLASVLVAELWLPGSPSRATWLLKSGLSPSPWRWLGTACPRLR